MTVFKEKSVDLPCGKTAFFHVICKQQKIAYVGDRFGESIHTVKVGTKHDGALTTNSYEVSNVRHHIMERGILFAS